MPTHGSIMQTVEYTIKPEKLAFIVQYHAHAKPIHTRKTAPSGQKNCTVVPNQSETCHVSETESLSVNFLEKQTLQPM